MAGDSAGGNLAAALCLYARDLGDMAPAAQLLVYAALDWRLETQSARDYAEGFGLGTEDMRWSWRQYAPNQTDLSNPLVSPAHATTLSGVAPAIVVTAEFDILRDEGGAYAERLQADAVRTKALNYGGALHGFFWTGEYTSVTATMLADVGAALHELW